MHFEQEIMSLILTAGVLAALIAFRRQLVSIPYSKLLLGALACYILRTVAAIGKSCIWAQQPAHLEHLLLFLSAVFLAIWSGLVFLKRRR
jgi:hypothetical protein